VILKFFVTYAKEQLKTEVWGIAEHGTAALVYITNNTADYTSTGGIVS
jgi:hypothetical protein